MTWEHYKTDGCVSAFLAPDQDVTIQDVREGGVGKFIVLHRDFQLKEVEDFPCGTDEFKAAGGLIVPIWVYSHSAVRLSLGKVDDWDSRLSGAWFVDADELKKEWGDNGVEMAMGYIKSELAQMNAVLSGDCYQVMVRVYQPGEDLCDPDQGDQTDWSFGHYIGLEAAHEAADEALGYRAEQEREAAAECAAICAL